MSPLPDQYPDQPGYKSLGPSEQAAVAVCNTAKALRDQVLRTICDSPAGLSADAVADRLGKSVLSVRPRVSELRRLGEIQPTTQRVKNASGMSATVWVQSPLPSPVAADLDDLEVQR
ncbi:hypothetical protein SAMN05444170_1000 [Bradyrhizobium erythrophlei]|uniref:Helix-turn-helix domain-containing protein n=1 Tax=Bradyrhizobium erythrophlei TaxID=1437360 RepID=A0A1M7T7A7_9BRAD|nr:hypothetical protein SAMN05444170_1000 [Bradyrhizobium erythrophlei]